MADDESDRGFSRSNADKTLRMILIWRICGD